MAHITEMKDLKTQLFDVLDSCFRERLSGAVCAHFKNHEFDEQEQHDLTDLCHAIAADGYRVLEERVKDRDSLLLLDTAAEYGCFVSRELAPSYLGVFVAAQMLMKPFAAAGFCREMMRSEVYDKSDLRHQQQARMLMLLATMLPEKVREGEESDDLRDMMADLSMLDLAELEPVKTMLKDKQDDK